MATIKFKPTTMYVYAGQEFAYEGEPLRTGGSNGYFTAMWFDVDEMLRVLNASTEETDANFIMNVIQTGELTLSMHKTETPSQQNRPYYYTTGVGWHEPSTGKYAINVNALTGEIPSDLGLPLGERATLEQALAHGFKGFVAYRGIDFPVLEAIDIEVEIEGNWDNQTPSIQSPVGGELQNVAEPIRFTWTHNSPLPQKSFELRYRVRGTSSWTTISETTSAQEYTLPANTLGLEEYEWQVRTISEYDFVSSWSSIGVFIVAEVTPTPTIISPQPNETIPIADLHVGWESVDQYEYELQLRHGDQTLWSETRISTDTERTIEDILENGESYTVRLRVRQDGELWSNWTSVRFYVEYTEPAKPNLAFVPDEERGALTVHIENPTPTGTQPRVVSQDLYRRRKGNNNWTMLARGLPNNGVFIDFTLAGNTEYEYRVRVYGDNETRTNSGVFTATLPIDKTIVSIPDDPESYIRLERVRERGSDFDFHATQMLFQGRKKPVTEFGETIQHGVTINCLIGMDEYPILIDLLKRQATLLYRDPRGRKLFATVGGLAITDEFLKRYSADMTLSEVDYKEGVTDD